MLVADRPVTLTRKLTRAKLASFLPNNELIKAFESLTGDVGDTLPDAIAEIGEAAEGAQTQASVAAVVAQIAMALAQQLQEGPPPAPVLSLEPAEDLAGQVAALRDEVATLRRLINERSEGPTP